jgi:hypothetical protein
LGDVLQRLAYHYADRPNPKPNAPVVRAPTPPTAKQRAKELQKAQAEIEALRATLRAIRLAPANFPDNAMRPTSDAKDQALDDLHAWKIAELQGRVARLEKVDGRDQSALTVESKYWRELRAVWLAVGDGRLHETALREFLLACARAPFYKTSPEDLEDRIDSFLSHSRQKPKAQTTR